MKAKRALKAAGRTPRPTKADLTRVIAEASKRPGIRQVMEVYRAYLPYKEVGDAVAKAQPVRQVILMSSDTHPKKA